jgi:hypothetical protein
MLEISATIINDLDVLGKPYRDCHIEIAPAGVGHISFSIMAGDMDLCSGELDVDHEDVEDFILVLTVVANDLKRWAPDKSHND